jgi:hypothetical protein
LIGIALFDGGEIDVERLTGIFDIKLDVVDFLMMRTGNSDALPLPAVGGVFSRSECRPEDGSDFVVATATLLRESCIDELSGEIVDFDAEF